MKKIYMLLVAILVVNFSFAQIAKQDVRTDGFTCVGKPYYHNTAAKAGAGSYWFDLSDALIASMPTFDFSVGVVPMLQDTVATINFSNGVGRPQFFGFAQVFDFTDLNWVYSYENLFDEETGMPIPVPALSETSTYSIDSMCCYVAYARGTNVPDDVVDTLVMTIAALNDDGFPYYTISAQDGPMFVQAELAYDLNTYTIPSQYTSSSSGESFMYDNYYTVKVPLTVADNCMNPDSTLNIVRVAMPVEGFDNLTTKNVAVSYTFISASPRTLDTQYDVDCNTLRGWYLVDPREGYDINGSPASMEDYNTSMCVMEYSIADPTFFLYGNYVSNAIWSGGLMRPGIGVHVTCDDCAWVNIEDVEENDMVVRPNPATEAFTVDFAQDAPATVQLFNLVGQQVYSAEVNASNLSVNVSEFNPGVYMLRVAQDGKVYTSKVIVK